MNTPIYDYVQSYIAKNGVRAHMPGHKGRGLLGVEERDITEIAGADVLAEASGIIGESQRNASELFQTGRTLYSTEGSSLAVKAMLYAALMKWQRDREWPAVSPAETGYIQSVGEGHMPSVEPEKLRSVETGHMLSVEPEKLRSVETGHMLSVEPEKLRSAGAEHTRPVVLAARNVHRAMIDGCALLDLDVEFIPGREETGICSAVVTPEEVALALQEQPAKPLCVYLTSPDYLGCQSDIAGIARVCHEQKVLLLVDNAHGAYLAFLEESRHPVALGADLCCDSAHKTLPVLTGGAYLHLHEKVSGELADFAGRGMTLFGSTSPSYLILQSLDLCNRYLWKDFPAELADCARKMEQFKKAIRQAGISVMEGEPLKLVLDTGASGYCGEEIGQELRACLVTTPEGRRRGIECEYADGHTVVLMLTPQNTESDWAVLYRWLEQTRLRQRRSPLQPQAGFGKTAPPRRMSIRQAVLAPSETVPVERAAGRILAQETVSCPPAIPIAVSGEEITGDCVELFRQYGIREVAVVRDEEGACHH